MSPAVLGTAAVVMLIYAAIQFMIESFDWTKSSFQQERRELIERRIAKRGSPPPVPERRKGPDRRRTYSIEHDRRR